jgi:iron complex transport system ATP-binding protein
LCAERFLHVWSDGPLTTLSSAVVGGGLTQAHHILSMRVPNDYAGRLPTQDLEAFARELGIVRPFVGLMTSVRLEQPQVVIEQGSGTTVVAILIVGLSHPVAAGVSEAAPSFPGTINAILLVDACLSPAARVNAVITATEAKTLALMEAKVQAPHGGPASGTGTDGVVIAATERGQRFEYAGPVAPLGALIGRAVRRAMQDGLLSGSFSKGD